MNLIWVLISFGLLIIAMTVHEFAHGWVAYKLGDNTAKRMGRLTLNPLAHIDPVGTIILPLFLLISSQGRFAFGAAKPVPVNFLALRNPKRDIIWVGIAGPLANFLLAFLLSLIIKGISSSSLLSVLLHRLALLNIILGVFNLMPIPPLDGSRVVIGLLPNALARSYIAIEPFGFFIIIGLIAIGFFNIVVWPIVSLIAIFFGII